MSKQTYLSRYSYIIERLEKGPATYEQIRDHLQLKGEISGEELDISQRTLQRDIRDIYNQTGYEILNERRGDKRYYIKERPQDTATGNRLLESYQLINIINSSSKYSEVVFLESRQPGGIEHFHLLLHAILKKLPVEFSYSKFSDNSDSVRIVHPLALKEAIGRWYLAAVDTRDGVLKTFGLDRISMPELHKRSFPDKYDADIEGMFRDSFGVMNLTDSGAERVVLSFSEKAGKFVESYPLHHSQKSEGVQKGKAVFSFNLVIAYDFKREIMSYGEEVTVVEPAWLRKEIVRSIQRSLSNYSGK